MFKELKLKIAARQMQRKSGRKATATRRRAPQKSGFRTRLWNIICWPFHMIGHIARCAWAWIRSIDLIGLVNLTLLVAIIVLFSMLIIDIIECRNSNVVVADAPAVAVVPERPQVELTDDAAPANIKPRPRPTLPLKRDPVTRKYTSHTITVTHTEYAHRDAPKQLNGDIIIERRAGDPVLADDVHINGNLYLQNMRKYTLPCGTVVHGNLFLRDVTMLQFCGDFTVTGNIYVSPRSSFGPIPRTARLGGQVIL